MINTVHAPHSPSAQPSFAPVSPRSRSRSSSVVWTPQSPIVTLPPLRFKENDLVEALFVINPHPCEPTLKVRRAEEPAGGRRGPTKGTFPTGTRTLAVYHKSSAALQPAAHIDEADEQ